jgi:hypothetical protein
MVKNSLNIPILFAALTMAVTFLVHVFIGGPELYVPLRASSLTSIEWSTFSVVWHFASMQLFLLAVVLFYLARYRNSALFAVTLATVIGFAGLFIGYGLVDLGSVLPMPQWTAFVIVATLMIWGERRS